MLVWNPYINSCEVGERISRLKSPVLKGHDAEGRKLCLWIYIQASSTQSFSEIGSSHAFLPSNHTSDSISQHAEDKVIPCTHPSQQPDWKMQAEIRLVSGDQGADWLVHTDTQLCLHWSTFPSAETCLSGAHPGTEHQQRQMTPEICSGIQVLTSSCFILFCASILKFTYPSAWLQTDVPRTTTPTPGSPQQI